MLSVISGLFNVLRFILKELLLLGLATITFLVFLSIVLAMIYGIMVLKNNL